MNVSLGDIAVLQLYLYNDEGDTYNGNDNDDDDTRLH